MLGMRTVLTTLSLEHSREDESMCAGRVLPVYTAIILLQETGIVGRGVGLITKCCVGFGLDTCLDCLIVDLYTHASSQILSSMYTCIIAVELL